MNEQLVKQVIHIGHFSADLSCLCLIGIKGAIGEPGLPGPAGLPGSPGERGGPGGNGKKK